MLLNESLKNTFHSFGYFSEKSSMWAGTFLNLNTNWIVTIHFRLIWHQTEYCMPPNQSEKYCFIWNWSIEFCLFNKIQKCSQPHETFSGVWLRRTDPSIVWDVVCPCDTWRCILLVLVWSTVIRFYLPFSARFWAKRNSVWFKSNRKMVNTIWFRLEIAILIKAACDDTSYLIGCLLWSVLLFYSFDTIKLILLFIFCIRDCYAYILEDFFLTWTVDDES